MMDALLTISPWSKHSGKMARNLAERGKRSGYSGEFDYKISLAK
jgi:hypothetical protein